MSDMFLYDLFLSHSSKDKSVVLPLAERLRADGLKVWFDEWELKPGDSIPLKIEEGLESSRVLVLCMSANAFGSDWTQLESGTFRFRDPLNKERRFIPLRLDDAPIKGTLAQFLYINWNSKFHEQEYAKLLESCRFSFKQIVSLPFGFYLIDKVKSDSNRSFNRIEWTRDGCLLAAACEDGKVWIWGIENITGDANDGYKVQFYRSLFVGLFSTLVYGVSWSLDGKYLAACSGDKANGTGQIRIWKDPINFDEKIATPIILHNKGAVYCVNLQSVKGNELNHLPVYAESPGIYIASGSINGFIDIWSLAYRKVIWTSPFLVSSVNCMVWDNDGLQLVAGCQNGMVHVFLFSDFSQGFEHYQTSYGSSPILSVAMDPGGKWIAIGGIDGLVRILDNTGRVTLNELEFHSGIINEISFSRSSKVLGVKSNDGKVSFWATDTWKIVYVLDETSSKIAWHGGVAFNPPTPKHCLCREE